MSLHSGKCAPQKICTSTLSKFKLFPQTFLSPSLPASQTTIQHAFFLRNNDNVFGHELVPTLYRRRKSKTLNQNSKEISSGSAANQSKYSNVCCIFPVIKSKYSHFTLLEKGFSFHADFALLHEFQEQCKTQTKTKISVNRVGTAECRIFCEIGTKQIAEAFFLPFPIIYDKTQTLVLIKYPIMSL